MNWLKEIAPLIGTALAGPLGGVAATFIADAMGVEEKTVKSITEALNAGKLTPEQLAAIKTAELEFEKFLKQNDVDLTRIAADDRNSARKMQEIVRSNIPGFLALLITVGFFGILVGLMYGGLTVVDNQSLLILLGALSTSWGSVVSYYFGSSHGSSEKNQIIHKLGDK